MTEMDYKLRMGFGLPNATKILKSDYKVRWDYKVRRITK